jgi:hypothetical protein
VLDQVDKLIREVLKRKLTLTDDQIGFQPPDDKWRTKVAGLNDKAVNIYLVDVRENQALRDPEWLLEFDEGRPQRRPGPMRVDCHYLISTWIWSADDGATDATMNEHQLLYGVLGALAEADPLNPSHFFPMGTGFDDLIKTADLPVQIVPAEGWPKLTEFWNGMGTNSRVKPALWYTVTVPVRLAHRVAGPLVTTRIIEFRQGNDPSTAEQWLQIAGTVLHENELHEIKPVEGAVVTITGADGEVIGTVTTGADGRFSLGALHAEAYELRAKKGALRKSQPVALPGKTAEYELRLQ